MGAEDFGGDVEGIEGGVFLEEAAVEALDGVCAEVAAIAHSAEQGAHFVPWAGAFGVVETALAFLDENVAQEVGRVAQDSAHVLAEEDEDTAVEEALGEAHELATGAGEAGVGLDEGAIDELAVIAVFAVEVFFYGLFADDLVAQQAVEHGCAAIGEEHGGLEDFPEDEAAEGGGGSVAKQGGLGGGGGAADDEALELPAPEAAGVEPELVHVGHEREERLGERIAVAALPGGLEVVEALFDRRAGVAFTGLAGVEAGADVFELAKDLRDAVAAGAESPERGVRKTGATGLACAGDFELRAAGVGGCFFTLELIAPSFREEALNEGGFGRALVEDVAIRPCAQPSEQGGGFGAGLKSFEFRAPLGAQVSVFEEWLGGHAAAGS